MDPGSTYRPSVSFGDISVTLRDDGIIHVLVGANIEIEVDDVKRIVEAVREIGGGKKYPLLIVAKENTLPTNEARLYIASEESDPYASAEAYVVQSLPQRLVANFFLSFNKPARPTKIFNDESEALEWLQAFL